MESVPQFLTLAESSAYLAARGILTPEGAPYNPGTLKLWCGRGDFPNAKTIVLPRKHTARPVWHIPTCDLDTFTLRRDRPKPGHTTKEAAAIMGVVVETVAVHIRKGHLAAVKVGKDWYVTDEAIEAFRRRERTRIETKARARQERIDPGPEKVCKRCGQARPIGDYIADPRYRDGYQSWCKLCYAEYRKKPEQRVKVHERYKERYADPEYRAQYREKSNALLRKRWRTDPEFRRRKIKYKTMFDHGRRSQERKGDLTAEQWQAICNHYGNKCLCCGKPEVTMDHIRPLSRGGKHTASNVQILCRSCNSRKMTKIIDYRPDKGKGIWRQVRLF